MWGEEESEENRKFKNSTTLDIVGILTRLTGMIGWKESNVPKVREGVVDFYYAHPDGGSDTRITLDEDAIRITVKGETLFAGAITDEAISEFMYPFEP